MKTFAGLSPKDPRFVLLELNKLVQAGKPASRVAIDTADGNRYQGTVVGVEEHPNGFFVLLENEKAMTGSSTLATYLDLRNSFQLTLLDASDFVNWMKFGAVNRWSTDDAITSLQFKRWAEPMIPLFKASNVNLEIDPGFAIEGLSGNVLRDVTQALGDYWADTLTDPIGAEELKKIAVVKLSFRADQAMFVERVENNLAIILDPKQGLPPRDTFISKLNAAF